MGAWRESKLKPESTYEILISFFIFPNATLFPAFLSIKPFLYRTS